MRYRLTILAVLALVDGAAGRTILAQGEPRQRVRLVGRVFDQTRRLVKGVEVTVNRREVRAVTDDAGKMLAWIHLADAAHAVLAAIERGRPGD